MSAGKHLTHCRCGAVAAEKVKGKLYYKRECPNSKDGKPFVYHDLCAQACNLHTVNWTVLPEDDKFRAYCADEPIEKLFDTEESAWVELDEHYWGRK